MVISNAGVPATDAWQVLKDLIVNNMASPDGVWSPVVNDGWLEFKRQKQFQIVLSPIIGSSEHIQLDNPSVTSAQRTTLYVMVTLFSPTRTGRWQMWEKFKELLNNQTLCAPTDASTGMAGVESTAWHFVKLERSEQSVDIRFLDDVCGPGKPEAGNCEGYRAEVSVMVRCNE
jgi:hypothetical protein